MPRWVSVIGNFREEASDIVFVGGSMMHEGRSVPQLGNFISDEKFGAGTIGADIQFLGSTTNAGCDLILFFDPRSQSFISAGLGIVGLCHVRTYFAGQWTNHATSGDTAFLQPGRTYNLRVTVKGSYVTLSLDGVDLIQTVLPYPLPNGQAGLWCLGSHDIRISNFAIRREKPLAFVVMQFSEPYEELFSQVIDPTCERHGIKALRASDAFGPGIIIADIARQISEAALVIADVTPANPNVYYEVGYAHALNKPTVLIAQARTELPFDLSPFRTLFYENSIGGKAKVEAGLEQHLLAIESLWGGR